MVHRSRGIHITHGKGLRLFWLLGVKHEVINTSGRVLETKDSFAAPCWPNVGNWVRLLLNGDSLTS